MRKLFIILGLTTLLASCGAGSHSNEKEVDLYVSILPLKGLAEQIMGPSARIEVLVPAGASPESFEPTPRQLIELSEARLVVGVGLLDFEQNLLQKLGEERPIHTISQGIDLLAGHCSLGHTPHHEGAHRHHHGIDPHVWTSPRELLLLSENLYQFIHATWPDSLHYTAHYADLKRRLEQLDQTTANALEEAQVTGFLIYHPAMSYYARAYGLTQSAIEQEGKEPSAKRLAELIDEGRKMGTKEIFYQSQFPQTSVEVLAQDLGGEAISFDPLAEDIITEIERFTERLCNH